MGRLIHKEKIQGGFHCLMKKSRQLLRTGGQMGGAGHNVLEQRRDLVVLSGPAILSGHDFLQHVQGSDNILSLYAKVGHST
jgi:hypothetical protein